MKRREVLRKGGATALTAGIASISGCSSLQQGSNCERKGRTGEDCRLDRELPYPEWLVRNRNNYVVQRQQYTGIPKLEMIKQSIKHWIYNNIKSTLLRTFPNVRLPNDIITMGEGVPGVDHLSTGYKLGEIQRAGDVRKDLSLEEVKTYLRNEFPDMKEGQVNKMGPILRISPLEIHPIEMGIEFPEGVTPGESDNAIANRVHEGRWDIMLSEYQQVTGHPQNPLEPGWLVV
jgi:hypothetical protein